MGQNQSKSTIKYYKPLLIYDNYKITVQGMARERFAINFTSGPDIESKDTALHFNPRFNEGCIVRNTKQHGIYGPEERDLGIPLQKGDTFEIVFHVLPDHFEIHINGRHFCNYNHRLPIQTVNYLVIYDDVEITSVKVEDGQPIKYIGSLQIFDNYKITVQGKAHQRFAINFSSQPYIDSKDTALHFNPRFNEGCIVRNSKQHGGWGPEERKAGIPLQIGDTFEIVFHVLPDHFEIHINGRHFCDYHHHLPKKTVNYLVIYGDVEIAFVGFEGGHQRGFNIPAGEIPPPRDFHPPGDLPPPYTGEFNKRSSPKIKPHSGPYSPGAGQSPPGKMIHMSDYRKL